jgi:hypothetical protein
VVGGGFLFAVFAAALGYLVVGLAYNIQAKGEKLGPGPPLLRSL